MWGQQTDSKRAAQLSLMKAGHGERTLHVRLAGTLLGDAAQIGLQVAEFDRGASFGERSWS